MKKFLLLGVSALGLAFVTERPADAWINSKFAIGMNWHWQSGGNNLFWGMFRNSQPPGPDHHHGGHGPAFPGFTPYGNDQFQYFGQNNGQQPQMAPAPNPTLPAATPPPGAMNFAPNLFQAASYTTGGYNPYVQYYPMSYYTPGYYGYYQSPSYWYGR
jgi:hypothetical protein